MKKIALLCLLIFLLAACDRSGNTPDNLPTPITSLDDLATAQFMTQNAPPTDYRMPVAFPLIDENLPRLTNWRYELYIAFNGVYSGTTRPVSSEITTQVSYNDVGPERRVVVTGSGELFGQEEGVTLEGVRLGGRTFLIRDGVCLVGDEETASALVADLRAGTLIGGVTEVSTGGHNATINSQKVWRYEFTANDVNLPQIQLGESGRIIDLSGELWISPEHNVVIRYYANLTVENALILLSSGENALPVTGDILIRYDVYDIGINPNITQPFGC